MNYSKREDNGFIEICDYVYEHTDETYLIIYDDEKLLCRLDSIALANNGVEKDNPGYEEYNVIVFSEPDDSTFEMSYHNIPSIMFCEKEIVFDRKEFEERVAGQYDDTKTVNIIFGIDGLIKGTNVLSGSFHTGIELVDNDEEVKKINKEASKIFKKIKDFNIGDLVYRDDDGKIRNNEKNKLRKLHQELIHRLDDINDGSYYVDDSFVIDNHDELTFFNENFKFTRKDWSLINNEESTTINNIGAAYYTKEDYKNAFPYYLVSALMGDDQALSNLGYCFMYGRYVEKNEEIAIALFTMAANRNNPEACYKLATIYRYNKDYKNNLLARKYIITAFNNIYDNYYYSQSPSLCLLAAREKINGDIFEKDLFGAYLLLLIAKDGYSQSLEEGFNPHEKQFNETIQLLEEPIFNECKEKYEDGDEEAYIFSIYKINPDVYHDEEQLLLGDSVITLKARVDEEEGTTLPIGSICYVCELHRDFVLVEYEEWEKSKLDGIYKFNKEEVKKQLVKFN